MGNAHAESLVTFVKSPLANAAVNANATKLGFIMVSNMLLPLQLGTILIAYSINSNGITVFR